MLLCNHALRASLQANWLLSKESELHEMKSSNIGGQAVIEGIMMKNGAKYAIAVRKPNGEIEQAALRGQGPHRCPWMELRRIHDHIADHQLP